MMEILVISTPSSRHFASVSSISNKHWSTQQIYTSTQTRSPPTSIPSYVLLPSFAVQAWTFRSGYASRSCCSTNQKWPLLPHMPWIRNTAWPDIVDRNSKGRKPFRVSCVGCGNGFKQRHEMCTQFTDRTWAPPNSADKDTKLKVVGDR